MPTPNLKQMPAADIIALMHACLNELAREDFADEEFRALEDAISAYDEAFTDQEAAADRRDAAEINGDAQYYAWKCDRDERSAA